MRRKNFTRMSLCASLLWVVLAIAPFGSDAGAATTVVIHPLGDSITVGYGPVTSTPGGYRSFFHTALNQAELPHRLVGSSNANASMTLTTDGQTRHDGHNGYRIDQVDADLDGVAGAYDDRGGHWLTGTTTRAALHPNVVLVHLGSNDLLKRYDPTNTYDDPEPLDDPTERALFVASMTDRLEHLVDHYRSLRPDATVVLSTVIPMDVGVSMDRAVADYARAVRSLAARYAAEGAPVVLVDAYEAFLTDGAPTPGLLSQDNVHPTPAGYALLGRLFADAVVAAT